MIKGFKKKKDNKAEVNPTPTPVDSERMVIISSKNVSYETGDKCLNLVPLGCKQFWSWSVTKENNLFTLLGECVGFINVKILEPRYQ